MTIEQLLGMSASQLEAMSNEELESYFSPFLKFTRPELQTEETRKKQKNFSSNSKRAAQENVIREAKNMMALFSSRFGLPPKK